MPIAREQLIADWRKRLAAAREQEGLSHHRAAWLARLRIRLYRVLTSLYGDGRWNAPSPMDAPNRAVMPAGVISGAEGVLPLVGKPAKSHGKIRAVLKSVANGLDRQSHAGTLTADKLMSDWFVVAAQNSHLDVWRCESLLRDYKIECRIQARGDDMTVEVPASCRRKAMTLLDKHLVGLRASRHCAERRQVRNFMAAVLSIFLIPVIGFALLLRFTLWGANQPVEGTVLLRHAALLEGAICVSIAFAWWVLWRSRSRARCNGSP